LKWVLLQQKPKRNKKYNKTAHTYNSKKAGLNSKFIFNLVFYYLHFGQQFQQGKRVAFSKPKKNTIHSNRTFDCETVRDARKVTG